MNPQYGGYYGGAGVAQNSQVGDYAQAANTSLSILTNFALQKSAQAPPNSQQLQQVSSPPPASGMFMMLVIGVIVIGGVILLVRK